MILDTEMLKLFVKLGQTLEKTNSELIGLSFAAGISIANEEEIIKAMTDYQKLLERPDIKSALEVMEYTNKSDCPDSNGLCSATGECRGLDDVGIE